MIKTKIYSERELMIEKNDKRRFDHEDPMGWKELKIVLFIAVPAAWILWFWLLKLGII